MADTNYFTSAKTSQPWYTAATPGKQNTTGQKSTPDNPFSKVEVIKSEPTDMRIDAAGKRYDSTANSVTDALNAFKERWSEILPQYNQYADESITQAYDPYFNGKYASQLKDIRSKESEARSGAVDRSYRRLNRDMSLKQLSRGGGGRALGSSSYMQKLGLDKTADLERDAALADVQSRLRDFNYLASGRINAAGSRQNILEDTANVNLKPVEADIASQQSLLALLENLSRTDQYNKFLGLEKEYGDYGQA